jgi:hypothetical protein
MSSHASVAKSVREQKERHPERYCRAKGCLWHVAKLDHATQTYSLASECLTGYCPRHKHLAQDLPSVQIEGSF